MRISHRARLTLVAAGTSGAIFLLLFVASYLAFQEVEYRETTRELDAALGQVRADLEGPENRADLEEVAKANPSLGLAIYDKDGRQLKVEGHVPVTNIISETRKGDLVLKSIEVQGLRIVAGTSWKPRQQSIDRIAWLGAILWLPLVGVVALATWLSARATFNPLERLASDAELMSVEDLSQRLKTSDMGEYRDFVAKLNGFLDRLEESVRREERFLSDAAHELRTPLTVLRGEIEGALRVDRASEDYKKTLAVLADETARLTNLVELLLQTASPHPASALKIELSSAIEQAHARWVDRFHERQVSLFFEGEEVSAGIFEPELRVVLDNLLANALMASPPNTSCSISIERQGGKTRIAIADEGSGVPEEDRERIFERFARGDRARGRREGGFGIGLALCRRIVDSWGGRIWVENNGERGARFVIEIAA